MEEGANKSVGIPNFVSLALGTCELNKYTILFVVVTVVDVDVDDGFCAKQDTGHTKDAPIAVVMIKIITIKLGFFISAV
jgi:hypothetical protein